MIRTLYHGSPRIIRTPRFGTGNAFNDFGIGFYCTDSPESAAFWASGHGHDGFVSTYRIDDRGLRILNLGSPSYCILHWLSILLSYREFDTLTPQAFQSKDYIRNVFSVDHQNYDIIAGWRADNIHFAMAQDFLNGVISYQQLRDHVCLSGLGRQIVLKSNRAFDRMLFGGYEAARSSLLFPAYAAREHRAWEHYQSAIHSEDTSGDIFIGEIMEDRVKEYDPRLAK